MSRSGVVAAELHVGSVPAAAVLQAVRTGGPITRDQLVLATGLSAATVNRQLHALTRVGLTVERPDLVDPGSIGRPKNPLTTDRDKLCVAGMHIGAKRTLLAIADIGGRTLYSHAVATPDGDGDDAIRQLSAQLKELADRFSGRRLMWGGLALGGDVDEHTGVVDHPVLGWHRVPVGRRLTDALGVPVSVCEHVQAMAAAELLLGYPRDGGGTGLFCYARETVGMAITFDGKVRVPARGAGTIAYLPVDAPLLSAQAEQRSPLSTTLQDVIGSEVLQAAALRRGQTPEDHELLDERARVLGQSLAMMRDVLNPDSIVVAGDAFAGHPRGLAPIQAAFDAASHTPWPLELCPSRFGLRVQEGAAIVVALSVLYADPITSVALSAD
ncbi:putative NagC family transcriptional regulator [Gordonia effusa NBRC 100432]|uniref:Putative NagC family transcriptional regulator n=1 Tax=Gordonia effusa NBRC 100432 TaxID=1077974 RepID=H0QXC7_9ACTN|nr:ROK family protein [Gordonia effusa]GAB17478.1 putative NagC family transcriptional regulator [Gordonia effusa NBRC 100432]